MSIKISKRYKDIFDLYIHRGEATPFSIGTIVVFALCFLILIVATFLQLDFSNTWLKYLSGTSEPLYSPQIPAMLFIIYLLGRNYSILLFITYLIIGLFFLPIFAFSEGTGFTQSYLFGYFLGFLVAIFAVSFILKKSIGIKMRMLASLAGVIAIHATGILYFFVLTLFKLIDFSLVFPMARILYDIIFSFIILLIAPYIKNIFWVCMKPKADEEKRSKRFRHKKQNN